MTDQRWKKIDEIFHAAIMIEAGQRARFIRIQSNGDESLIAEISKLVSAHENAQSFIDKPVADQAFEAISEAERTPNDSLSQTGRTVGPYTLIEQLGRGAFGEVWLAENRTALVSGKFALKFPNDPGVQLESIRKEATLWHEAGGHPNILPLIEANVYNGQAVFVSEYVKDGSLDNWLRKSGSAVPQEDVSVGIMRGILEGIEHLHSRKIVHRDLKPANVLMQEGKPRLTDFGISKILTETASSRNNLSGTVAYMSPEALEGKKNYGSDLWSAGVVFYQLLTGQLPFQAPDQVSLMMAIVNKPPIDLTGNVKQNWQPFFETALNKDPNRRFQTAAQMRQAIERTWTSMNLEPVTLPQDVRIQQTSYDGRRIGRFEETETLTSSSPKGLSRTPYRRMIATAAAILFVLLSFLSAGFVWHFYTTKPDLQAGEGDQAGPVKTRPESRETPTPTGITGTQLEIDIAGDNRESNHKLEAPAGETVIRIELQAKTDVAGAKIRFKGPDDEEITPFVLIQANTTEGPTTETVRLTMEKRTLINLEIEELQYGSRATYPGKLKILISNGGFIAK